MGPASMGYKSQLQQCRGGQCIRGWFVYMQIDRNRAGCAAPAQRCACPTSVESSHRVREKPQRQRLQSPFTLHLHDRVMCCNTVDSSSSRHDIHSAQSIWLTLGALLPRCCRESGVGQGQHHSGTRQFASAAGDHSLKITNRGRVFVMFSIHHQLHVVSQYEIVLS